MPAMDATFYADCEIIIKCFEKAAAFSSDPKSVYALSTTLISKGRANAESIDRQIGTQFEHVENHRLKNLGFNKPGMENKVLSNEKGNQVTKGAQSAGAAADALGGELEASQSETPWADEWKNAEIDLGDGDSWKLENCIPCAARIAGAEMAVADIGERLDDWTKIGRQNLEGILKQLEQMMEMFKDQGRSALKGLCEFLNIFKFDMCPSDLLRIISALSAALVKLSIDIFGDLGMFLNLAKAILTPILSAGVQILHTFMQQIIAPINCILDKLQEQLLGAPGTAMEMISNEIGSWEYGVSVKSTLADPDWTLTQAPGPRTPSDSLLPDTSGPVGGHPFETEPKDIWSAHSETDWGSYEEFLKLEKEIQELKKSKPSTARNKELNEKQKKFDQQEFNKATKAIKDFNESIDGIQSTFNNVFEATWIHLTEIAQFIEEFLTKWIEELAKLVGGGLTVEFGFNQKAVKKLGLITLIGTFLSLVDFLQKDAPCDNAETLESIIQAQFKGTDHIIRKEDDGTLTVFGIDTDVKSGAPKITFDLTDTGNEDMDALIQNVVSAIQKPAATVSFSCRQAIPQDADAAQLNKWIAELETAGI